jgi:8-amino-7-oxononanoate synthase
MLDEAHSIGVLGATGRGLTEECAVDPTQVDLLIGTLSKTFATSGGFVAGHPDVIEWLRFTLPGFVYSVGQSPVLAASALAALRILKAEPERVTQLRAKAAFFRETALNLGLDVGGSRGLSVVPILFQSTEETILASQALLHAGFYCPPIVQMGIPKDQPRLRFFISAGHDCADMQRALETLAQWRDARETRTGMRSAEAVRSAAE